MRCELNDVVFRTRDDQTNNPLQAFMENEALPEYEKLVDIDRKTARELAAKYIKYRYESVTLLYLACYANPPSTLQDI